MGNENLISKKELLERYHISYGALYRWKRKGLIPDEWFLKKATATGQETFFPEKLVCERIERIQSMKEDVFLDELAKQFSGEEKKNEFLVLQTEFGEKSFRMCDVKSITLTDKNGNETDITKEIQKILEEIYGGKR
ncbi:MAG: DUF4004 family protein [Clostridia bacterium]|nr:DUF4004 family protein [Clostridia bacterium]